MFVSHPSNKLIELEQLVQALLQRQPVTVHQIKTFLGKTSFVSIDMHNFANCFMSVRGTC